MSKFKFGKGEGFKMPGLGSKEISTPGSFRQEQGVEDVGYCLNTEQSMLPKGSSPLLAKDASFLIPDYYSTTYTSRNLGSNQKKTIVEEGESGSEDDTDDVVSDKIKTTDTDNPDTNEYAKRMRQETTYAGGGKLENAEQRNWMINEKNKIKEQNPDFTDAQVDQAYRDKYEINPVTIDIYEISFDGGKTYSPASKEQYDAHGGAKKKS